MKYAYCFLLILLLPFVALADIKLPALIGDNMVLQQRTSIALWGWADPGEKITVLNSWNNKSVKTLAGPNGEWQLKVTTPQAGGPYVLTISGKNKIELKNVLIGEVWLCSGQSNMEFPLGKRERWRTGVINYEKEIAGANFPNIRMFTVKQTVAQSEQKDVNGKWEVCAPQTAGDFSAVAYYFGKEIAKETGYPVGLIHSSWGGTPAESWVKKSVLESDPDFKPILERYNTAVETYPQDKKAYETAYARWEKEAEAAKQSGQAAAAAPQKPIEPAANSKSPTKLFNGMIAPLIPYTLRGVIWYQGESNSSRAYQYRKLFPALINSWRNDWKQNLPFYFVQIAPHHQQHPEIREAQFLTLKSVPKTGMAVATDAADSLDIHPRNKEIPGKRLALWALAKTYNKKQPDYSGPLYKSMKVEGNKIRIEFEHAKSLVSKESVLREFTIAGEDRKFVPARAVIEGNTVLVSSPSVDKPLAVRFAWRNYSRPNLYNEADLPASPFRTDVWPAETAGNN